ncbi:orotidine-5'-phosphate decarboxylase [Alteribacillus iranensis]|uniref:Orotidine 5'-phosphate decarboxylase n=1 Tax=Alteribacillus iranensis TaxID=930128 RepID=A0A1I2A9S1_9BACI|nr:orotidine-5'-phosphate decarboxylase [Alteribacillus iranensis]SFE40328.1 orotidine-5'-phosphate decarboxylase [Alteribacillus iranensis]
MKEPVIIAMDFDNKSLANTFLKEFGEQQLFLKVGMELFYKEGPSIIWEWKEAGHHIFLDLKLHDIPNTVREAARQIAALGVDMTTIHAAGGIRMMEAAREGLEAGTPSGHHPPACLAVTQLTSTSEDIMREELLIDRSLEDTVIHYAQHAMRAGATGVICSALEVPSIKERVGQMCKTVTPGIRLKHNNRDDQKRVVSPYKAHTLGSDAIVVGRSVTKAANPAEAYQEILKQWRNDS